MVEMEEVRERLDNGGGHEKKGGVVHPDGLVLDLQDGPAHWTGGCKERIHNSHERDLDTKCCV